MFDRLAEKSLILVWELTCGCVRGRPITRHDRIDSWLLLSRRASSASVLASERGRETTWRSVLTHQLNGKPVLTLPPGDCWGHQQSAASRHHDQGRQEARRARRAVVLRRAGLGGRRLHHTSTRPAQSSPAGTDMDSRAECVQWMTCVVENYLDFDVIWEEYAQTHYVFGIRKKVRGDRRREVPSLTHSVLCRRPAARRARRRLASSRGQPALSDLKGSWRSTTDSRPPSSGSSPTLPPDLPYMK